MTALNLEAHQDATEFLGRLASEKAQVIDELVVELARVGLNKAQTAKAYHLEKAKHGGNYRLAETQAADASYWESLHDTAKAMLTGLQSSLKIDRMGSVDQR